MATEVNKPYNQPTLKPTSKVAAGGAAGLATTIVLLIVTVLGGFGVVVPDNVSESVVQLIGTVATAISLLNTIVSFAASYIKKESPKEYK